MQRAVLLRAKLNNPVPLPLAHLYIQPVETRSLWLAYIWQAGSREPGLGLAHMAPAIPVQAAALKPCGTRQNRGSSNLFK